jgi:hypothetical protein
MRLPFRSLCLALGLAFLTVSSAALAYYRIFTGFAEWDDEGMLMMTVRQFLTGGTLYENIRTGYGPAYYFYNWLVRTLSFTGVTHDATRMTSMVVWTVCPIACAWIVWRLGRSLVAALLTHALVFRAMSFLCNEPGHPQELCLMLLIALVASGLAAESVRTRRIALVLGGMLPAALLLVKVNIGIFAILAVSLAMLYHAPRAPLVNAARYLAGGASLALPFLLMRAHLNDPSELAYCVAVTAGVAALLAGAAERITLFSFRDCAIAAAAFACTCALFLSALWLQGVEPGSIATSLVLQHIQLSVKGGWYLSVTLSPWWILWAIGGPAAALFVARSGSRITAPSIHFAFGRAALSAAALLFAAIDSGQGSQSSLSLGLMVPFCWLLAAPLYKSRPSQAYARTLLAALATLQTLYAFPIAGSQGPFTHVLLIVVAGVCLADALSELPHHLCQGVPAKGLAALIVACVLLSYPVQAWRARRTYDADTPMNLPGARRIRLDREGAATFQWLARELNQNCDTFVGYPGLPSLYFWTGMPMPGPAKAPPGPLNAGSWTLLLTPPQQQSIADEFAQHPRGCAIYHPSGVKFWNRTGIDESSMPLVNFVQHNFKTVGAKGDYQFQVRNDRAWAPIPR